MVPIHIIDDEDPSSPPEDWGAEVGKAMAKGTNEVTFMNPINREPISLEVGDEVWYWANFGTGPRLEAVIIGIGEKHGELVYDCELEGLTGIEKRWGYADQFERRDEE